MGLDYVRDPAEIYRQSFEKVRREADLSRFSAVDAEIVVRIIHASGRLDITDGLAFSDGASEAGISALAKGAPVFCDAEMVASGITRSRLPADNEIVCTLNDPNVPAHAKAIGNTRSAAALDFWGERLAGAVVAIGNAPTALFHLLELIDQGAPKPALIVGMPVGFVGAAESKAELIANSRGVPFISLTGYAGGSAMASAAINAIAGLAATQQ